MTLSDTWLLLLTFGTVARLVRLVNKDTLTEPFRKYVAARAEAVEVAADEARIKAGWDVDRSGALYWPGPDRPPKLGSFLARKWHGFWPWLDDLVSCPYCVGVWVSLPTAAAVVLWPTNRFVTFGLVACTASLIGAWAREAEQQRFGD